MRFATLHNRHQNGDPHSFLPTQVNNLHQELDGTVRIAIEYPGGTTYPLDPTETYQEVLDELNAALAD